MEQQDRTPLHGMRPSDVVVCGKSVLPFCGSEFGSAEREFAAALLVRACVRVDDSWAPRTFADIEGALRADLTKGEVFEHLVGNPFLPNPGFPSLIREGFARAIVDGHVLCLDDPRLDDQAIRRGAFRLELEFTEKGMDTLRPFARQHLDDFLDAAQRRGHARESASSVRVHYRGDHVAVYDGGNNFLFYVPTRLFKDGVVPEGLCYHVENIRANAFQEGVVAGKRARSRELQDLLDEK